MIKRSLHIILLGFLSCAAVSAQMLHEAQTGEDWGVCTDPRPEMCTAEYAPVCAQKDNGIRCVTAPCPSSDLVTYANACSACSDTKVYAYRPGTCGKGEK